MKLLYVAIISLSCLIACKSKYNTPYDYTGDKITFGSGGGFSGKITEYTLLSNGDFYKGTGSEGFVDQLPHDMKDKAKQFFSSYDAMKFDTLNINETGNMTHYIVIDRKDKEPHRIQWADYVEAAPESLRIYHKNLFAFAKSVNTAIKDGSLPIK